MVRRISALALAFTVSMIGIPLPVHAAENDAGGLCLGVVLRRSQAG